MIKLYQHQEEGLRRVLENEKYPLFMEQGTGKSAIAIKAIEKRYLSGEISRALLFVPNSIIYNWTIEFEKFLDLNPDEYVIETLSKKEGKAKRIERLHNFYSIDLNFLSVKRLKELGYKGKKKDIVNKQKKKLMILLINFEKSHSLESELRKFKPDLLVVDESQKVKNRNSQTAKAIYRLTRATPYRIIMTGTPIMNKLEDIFMQYKIMDEDILGPNFKDFQNRYLVMGGFKGKEVVDYKNKAEIKSIIERTSYRVKIDEVIELPPLRTKYLTTELQPKTKKVYNELNKEMVTRIEKASEDISRKKLKELCRKNSIEYKPRDSYKTLLFRAIDIVESASCDLVITQLIRLQQITGGFITRDGGDLVQVGDEKIKLAKEEILNSTQPTLIFCKFVAEIEHLQEELSKVTREGKKLRVAVYRDKSTRKEVYDQFQKGEVDVLILQFQSGSVGLNLQKANRLIFYSWSFSSGEYQQAISRIKRSGQKNSMEIIHLVAEDTIDLDILDSLNRKKELAKMFLG